MLIYSADFEKEVIPAISVVIPTYNRADTLGRCINSLINQTFKDFEVIVCDDGSTDNTADLIADINHTLNIAYHYMPNSGRPACPRNYGIRMARSPYVAFLDSDDWWTPDKLEKSLQYLATGADIVYHDMYLVRNEGGRIFRRMGSRKLFNPVFLDLLSNGNALCNSSVIVRKKLLEDIGLIMEDSNLRVVEDYDTWLRISRLTEKFVKVPGVLGYYWTGGGNITNPSALMLGMRAIEKRYFNDMSSPSWPFSYVYGRCSYLLRDFDAAFPHLWRTAKIAPLSNRARAIWMLLMMIFYRKLLR